MLYADKTDLFGHSLVVNAANVTTDDKYQCASLHKHSMRQRRQPLHSLCPMHFSGCFVSARRAFARARGHGAMASISVSAR
jgi:hypothetical protein